MRVRWTRSANRDIEAIFQYIRKNSLESARRVKLRIVEEVSTLNSMPSLGHPGSVEGTRELVLAWSYIAVYIVIRDEVQILRIRHAAQEWPPPV